MRLYSIENFAKIMEMKLVLAHVLVVAVISFCQIIPEFPNYGLDLI